MVDLLADSSFRIHPLTERDAAEMIDELRGVRLLRGYRGAPQADEAALRDVILRVSTMVTTCPEIQELDLNPVKVQRFGACVVDARVRVERQRPSSSSRRVQYLHWTTVIVFGRFKELAAARGDAVDRAYELLRDRREWWLPAAAKTAISERYVPIAYRIRIDSMSGRRAAR